MNRLAIDTTESVCSVALRIGDTIVEERVSTTRQHAEKILDMIKGLLEQGDISLSSLDGIAFSRGPGSFTGLRIAASVTQGLAVSQDLPVIPVSSLQALAQGAYRQKGYKNVHALFDARMGEVYWGAYKSKNGLMLPIQDERVCHPGEVSFQEESEWVGVGSGFKAYQNQLQNDRLKDCLPEVTPLAYDVLILSAGEPKQSAEHAIPVYVRDNVTRS